MKRPVSMTVSDTASATDSARPGMQITFRAKIQPRQASAETHTVESIGLTDQPQVLARLYARRNIF